MERAPVVSLFEVSLIFPQIIPSSLPPRRISSAQSATVPQTQMSKSTTRRRPMLWPSSWASSGMIETIIYVSARTVFDFLSKIYFSFCSFFATRSCCLCAWLPYTVNGETFPTLLQVIVTVFNFTFSRFRLPSGSPLLSEVQPLRGQLQSESPLLLDTRRPGRIQGWRKIYWMSWRFSPLPRTLKWR